MWSGFFHYKHFFINFSVLPLTMYLLIQLKEGSMNDLPFRLCISSVEK